MEWNLSLVNTDFDLALIILQEIVFTNFYCKMPVDLLIKPPFRKLNSSVMHL